MINPALYSSQSGNWDTPQDFFDTLNEEFTFTLDVCADNNNHKCPIYYTEQDDGLQQIWADTVWCNPPYGRKIIHWMKKAYESSLTGATVVCLVPSATDTVWWHNYAMKGEIRFLRGRPRFETKEKTWQQTFSPSVIVIFKPYPIITNSSRNIIK